MEKDSFRDNQPSPETVADVQAHLNELPGRLGFVESEKLVELQAAVKKASSLEEQAAVRELLGQYHMAGQAVVEQEQGIDFARAQIGLLINMSLIRRDAGDIEGYILGLEDALAYADGMGFDAVVILLEAALAQADVS